MKGTITWLPIEDAPKEKATMLHTELLLYEEGYYPEMGYFVGYRGESWYSSKGHRKMKPTHFAYINAPEVKP